MYRAGVELVLLDRCLLALYLPLVIANIQPWRIRVELIFECSRVVVVGFAWN